MKILIVDDSAEVRKSLKRMLSNLKNIEIIEEAEDGIRALGLIEELHPDIVTLDIQISDINGFNCIAEIKKRNPSTVIIILTNHTYHHFKQYCFNADADYFFDKSNEFEDMIKLIKQLTEDLKNIKETEKI